MEDLVRIALAHYNSFRSQAALEGKWEDALRDDEMRERIHLASLRVEMIQNWLTMLTYDERFALEKHLIEDLEWQRVVHVFGKHWDELFFRSDRQLGTYQSSALRKIVSYCKTYEDIINWLFDNLNETEHLLESEDIKETRSLSRARVRKRLDEDASKDSKENSG
ncbi:MAG TPA: hypothetical protein GX006_00810 [Clostridiales bacterium]|nr:hypothetical protein [Clostridiales bacterium]